MANASSSTANLGFEDRLWQAAEKLRGNMDAAEYKHVVLGLIFLKYISDAFLEKHAALSADKHADPEDKDEYLAENIPWVPPEARWGYIQKQAKDPKIGTLIDNAMTALERENKAFKGVLPKDYARPALDKRRLGEVIDLIATIGLGDKESRQRDVLGRVYEYFLGKFAEKEGKGGGEFYTPSSVVNLLVEMLEPYKGRVLDPCCGSGGMFVQALKFVAAHASGNGNGTKAKRDIAIYGQESNYTTWRLAQMNLAIRGIDGDIQWGDSFLDDKHKDLKADFIIANPPFNMEDWGYSKVKSDARWRRFDSSSAGAQFSLPPGGERKRKDGSTFAVDGGNANYAWILHFLHHLAPHGTAGFVLANGSLTSNTSGEGEIQTYKHDIPSLFAFNEAVVISDGFAAKIGTLTAGWDRFMPWRTADGEGLAGTGEVQLDVLIRGVFEKRRFIDYIQHFITFEDDGKTIAKKAAAYHQYWAVNKAMETTVEASRPEGDQRAGVIWHTQGRPAERFVHRVHRHAAGARRQEHAGGVRRLHRQVRHPARRGRRCDGADLLRVPPGEAGAERGGEAAARPGIRGNHRGRGGNRQAEA